MKGPYSGEPGVDWHLKNEPRLFHGTPRECRGELTLVNPSNSKVKIRRLNTLEMAKKRKDSLYLTPSQINLFARLAPNSELRVTAQLQLPDDTAPGHYQTTIACGQQTYPIDVTIIKHHEMLITPSHIRVKGESGDIINCQLTISNLGNDSFEIGDTGLVWLREHNWVGRTLVYTLRDATPEDSAIDFQNRLLHNFRNDLIPAARIQFSPSKVSMLASGQTLIRDLTLTLPPGLMKGRRYLGFIKINDQRVWLEVYCNASQKQKIQ